MAYVRVKKRNKKAYYYLVESSRNGKKVKQVFLRYLGTEQPSRQEVDRIIEDIKLGK